MSEIEKTEAEQAEPEPPPEEEAPEEALPEEALPEEALPEAEDPAQQEGAAAEPDQPEERDYEAEIAELNDRLLRTLAEGENLRRRAQREREETLKYAIAGFARDVLGVGDNLRRALETLPEGSDTEDGPLKSFIEGVALTERDLLGILQRHGVEKVDPAGDKFDHNLHEAMFEVPTAEAAPGTVVQVVEAGYVLNGRLLRAARVGVAKSPPVAPAPPEDTDTSV